MKSKLGWLALVVGITALTGWMFGAQQALQLHAAYSDNERCFCTFRENAHCLNSFGEVAWWFPNNQYGFPGYYNSLLGQLPIGTPSTTALMFVFWFLGKLQIHIKSWFPIYVFYYAFLQPLLLNFATLALVKQLFRDRIFAVVAVVLSAISPGVVLNTSDIGVIEPTAYALFFLAAGIHFLKSKKRTSIFPLILSGMSLMLTLGWTFLLWTFLAVPTIVILILIYPRFYLWRIRNKWNLLWLGLAMGLAALPCLLAYTQEGELIRTRIGGGLKYTVDQLVPGNPLEFVKISTPGLGMRWVSGGLGFVLWNPHEAFASSYMAMPTLALAILGLVAGKRLLRVRLTIALVFFGCVVALAATSPWMRLLIAICPPLMSISHFSDLTFRAGGYLVFLLAAVNGAHALIYGGVRVRVIGAVLYAVSALSIILTHKTAYAGRWDTDWLVGFTLLICLVYLIIFVQLCREVSRAGVRRLVWLLVLVILIDGSTVTSNGLKTNWTRNVKIEEPMTEDANIGLRSTRDPNFGYVTETLISYKSLMELLNKNINPDTFPFIKIYGGTNQIDLANITAPAAGRVGELKRTYNQIDVTVESPEAGKLFVRDAYSPFWKATVNGRRVPVERVVSNFKAIPIGAGVSVVKLRFFPWEVAWTLSLVWVLFAVIIGWWIWLTIKAKREITKRRMQMAPVVPRRGQNAERPQKRQAHSPK